MKSDVGKDWVKRRKAKNIRIHPEYHLIITEGTETEPNYFDSIRNLINQKYRDRIFLEIEGMGDNTINLFHRAVQRASNNPNGFRHVWIVFDTDDFPADHINRTVELCEASSSDETQYHAIWSNQCIEIWYLLHFGFYQSDLHRQEYIPKLDQWLKGIDCGKYEKNRKDMYEVLKPFMDQALVNAKRLDKINAGKSASLSRPGTKVYEIIELLRPYL